MLLTEVQELSFLGAGEEGKERTNERISRDCPTLAPPL